MTKSYVSHTFQYDKTSLCSRNAMIALVCSDRSCLNPIVAAAQSMSILSFSFASILVVYVISVDDVTQSDWRVRFWLQKQKSLVRGTRPFLFGLGLARETRVVGGSVQFLHPQQPIDFVHQLHPPRSESNLLGTPWFGTIFSTNRRAMVRVSCLVTG